MLGGHTKLAATVLDSAENTSTRRKLPWTVRPASGRCVGTLLPLPACRPGGSEVTAGTAGQGAYAWPVALSPDPALGAGITCRVHPLG